ncbi:MAG TPA: hydroxyacid dehydrogenase, partial [Candidatus Dorea intestinavium]|nr:hydroxyacid dehydrogenase [Candidatus Dorea intestinavium]
MRKEDDIIQSELMALIADYNGKIIVLDDDPTGVQTVHDVYVYTDWSIDNIRRGFREENKLFYILTNSRSFTKEQTTICHNEVITNVEIVAKEEDIDIIIISRSDSTLRGHYPLENEILKKG